MIPSVGASCLFTFITKFSTLNGVYRVRAEITFSDAVASGVDFVSNLYTPAGLSAADFNTDYPTYLSDRVTVLESVTDNTIVHYTPESIFATIPDSTIREYYPLILVVNLGVQKNTQAILPVLDSVEDIIKASLGTTDALRVVTNPENKIYLTDSQYQTLVDARAENVSTLVPLSVQLAQEQAMNTFLAAKVAAYENMIRAQST